MNTVERMQCEIVSVLGEIDEICRRYGYEVVTTLLLRHESPGASLLITRDAGEEIVAAVQDLDAHHDDVNGLSPQQALWDLLCNEDSEE